MVVTEILKVFYAPHKVFKEIVQKPSYIAPLVVLVLFVIVQFGSSYVVASRSFIEQTMPTEVQKDAWTENATLWRAGSRVVISENNFDFINASAYYNNTSIEFKVSNSSSIQIELTALDGSVNCGADGFKNMSFRTKILAPSTKPENVTLLLYSLGVSNYFTYDLTPAFSNYTANVWNNITVPVGSGSWLTNGVPNWENVTSLRIDFQWETESNLDLRIDGLFFRGIYKTQIEIYGNAYLLSSAFGSATDFLLQWVVLAAVMFLLIKGLKASVFWKPLLISVGVALIILVVQSIALSAAFSTLPNLYYPIEYLAGVSGEFEAAYKVLVDSVASVNTITGAVIIIILAWNVALGAFIVREVTSVVPPTLDETAPSVSQPLSLMRSFIVSVGSVLLTFLLTLVLQSLGF